MASIFSRINKDGSVVYRVLVRRKGLPLLTMTFETLDEAEDWLDSHEENYIKNPIPYLEWIKTNRLSMKRQREFKKKC